MAEGESANFDFAAFKQAFVAQDIDAWASFFSVDAEWLEYRHTHPPRAPNRMVGKSEIRAFLSRVRNSNVTLAITDEVIGPTRAAFCVTCTLPDGLRRIIEHVIIHYSGGRITRQVDVEAWD
jgi:SnoaL-like domain